MTPIKRVLVVGSGWVGRQVGARLASFGVAVALTDKDAQTVSDAVRWMATSHHWVDRPLMIRQSKAQSSAMAAGSSSSEQPSSAEGGSELPRSSTPDWLSLVEQFPPLHQLTLDDVHAWQPDLTIECVPEQLSLKKRVLRRVCELVPDGCIIASNSSYFVPSLLAKFVRVPQRFAHLHFHVPVLRQSVADIVGCSETAPEVLERLADLCQRIEQYPLVLRREHPGYVFNWLLQSLLKAALELAALDVADIEEIDRSWKSVTGMPLGPFGMMDQIGLDVIDQVLSNARWAEPIPVDSQQLLAMLRPRIQSGKLGIKSGAGFYKYE